MPVNLESSAVVTGLEKFSFHSSPKAQLLHNCTYLTHEQSNTQNQARLEKYVNSELPDVQAGFIKGRGTRDKIANICWIIKKKRAPESIHFFLDNTKAFDCEDHNKL